MDWKDRVKELRRVKASELRRNPANYRRHGEEQRSAFRGCWPRWGFARHPVDWLKSRWAWAVLTGFPGKWMREPAAAGHWMAGCWSDRFEEFIAAYLDTYPGIATATCRGMLGWIPLGKAWHPTKHAVDFIGRTERLHNDLLVALDMAGEKYLSGPLLATAPQRVGARGELARACHLSEGLRRRVIEAESGICKVLGYS